MILFPPAKINLGLNVLKKRDDGYHAIKSCMVEIPLHDVLEILPSDTFTFEQTGRTIDGNDDDNLCVRAYRLMEAKYSVPPVYMHLRKIIPMGAGLGGGSADATYVILGLNKLFELNLSDEIMEKLASELGSDCAFFVKGGVQMSEGRGEILTPLDADLKGLYLKLNYPELHIGTGEAYSHVSFDPDCEGYDGISNHDFSGLKNSFESYAFEKHPKIQSIRDGYLKEGAFYAAMSGSGSSVFGIFKEKPEETENPNEWVLEF